MSLILPEDPAIKVQRLRDELRIAEQELAQTQGDVVLTSDLIHSAGNNGIGFTRAQVECLGIPWPPTKGWLRSLVGQTVQRARWEEFVSLRKQKPRK